MNAHQVAHFAVTYARMSDEELAHLYVTRGENLSEEATAALSAEMQKREPGGFRAELTATRVDLAGQAAYDHREERKQAQLKRAKRRALYYFSFLAVVAGASFWLANLPETGAAFLGLGIGLPVVYELRRLLSRVVAALFRMN